MTTTTKRTRSAAAAGAPAGPVKRAPAKRAAPAKATTPPAPIDGTPVDTIIFRGRTMLAKRPSPEQLGMWKVTGDELSRVGPGIAAERASVLLARAIKLITTVLADDVDRDWLHDQLLDGTLSLEDAAGILTLAAAAFHAAAPSTGPRPKARRGR